MLNRILFFCCLLLGLVLIVSLSNATPMIWDDKGALTGTSSAAVRGPLPLVSTSDTTGRQDNAIFLPRWSCDEEAGVITITAMIGSNLTVETRALCRAAPASYDGARHQAPELKTVPH